ncbi:MAG: hypothetical protein QM770_06365 [Tepidisphaeraceae bacterium]
MSSNPLDYQHPDTPNAPVTPDVEAERELRLLAGFGIGAVVLAAIANPSVLYAVLHLIGRGPSYLAWMFGLLAVAWATALSVAAFHFSHPTTRQTDGPPAWYFVALSILTCLNLLTAFAFQLVFSLS